MKKVTLVISMSLLSFFGIANVLASTNRENCASRSIIDDGVGSPEIRRDSNELLSPFHRSTMYNVLEKENSGGSDSSADCSTGSNTNQVPAQIPYIEGFEGTSGWTMVNGTQTNKWFEGTAVNNGGTGSLYISNDGGVSNIYTLTSISTVHAYRDIAVPTTCVQELNLTFDWRAMGQTSFDYFRVWIVPATFTPTAGTTITTSASGGVQLGQFSGGANFATQTYTYDATAYAGQVMRVVFEWKNNSNLGSQSPAAIDNFAITFPACPVPYNLSVLGTNAAGNSTVSWTPGCTETSWEIITLPTGSPAPTVATVGTLVTVAPPYMLAGLQLYNTYDFYVRAVCSPGTSVSAWSAPKTFTTTVGSPGGVSANMTLWLKADAVPTITNNPVQNWSTSGGSAIGFSVSQANAANRPALIDGATNYATFNYNPKIDFVQTSNTKLFNSITTPNLLGTNGTAIVISTEEIGNVFTYSSSGRYQLKPSWRFQSGYLGTGYTFDWTAPTEYSANASSMMCSYGCATTMELRKNSVLTSTTSNVGTLYNPSISSGLFLGANNGTEYSDSSIAEVILFDRKLTLAEMDKIETYLSVKYGITRGGNTNTTALYNYIASNGTTVFWDKEANTGFNNDIAVIGRDDNSALNQKQSITRNNGGTLTISLGNGAIPTENATNTATFSNDLSFLGWGNNGLTTTFNSGASKPAGVLERLDRVWKTTATNFNQQTSFGFENSQIAGMANGENLCLLFDEDGVDLSDAIVVAACSAVNTGSRIEFSGIAIPAGKPYFTLARLVTPTLITNNGPICEGETLDLTSETVSPLTTYLWTGPNGFTSTEQNPSIPAVTTSANGTYSVSITYPGCSPTILTTDVVINAGVLPTFDTVGPICTGESIAALPTISNEGITGVWLPALDNTTTTTYTFTPDLGQCATVNTMTIIVNQPVVPTFETVASICSGETLQTLPTTSIEGVTGTWSPELNNLITTTYTFTPDAGQCADTADLTIEVNEVVTPTFDQVAAICPGDTLENLPTTSNEGVTGTWSPSLNNEITTTYTFVPTEGQCSNVATMTIEVSAICEIPRGISPNGDGMNDTFDLGNFNVVRLSVFNRYGLEVYKHGSGYTNEWHGQSEGGKDLPDGTYFYVIDTASGQTKTGWIYINRER